VERWRAALRELGDQAADVCWRYGAFELDPTVPAEGTDARAYLEAKYDAATVRSIHERLAAVAAAEGLPLLDMAELRVRPNTFTAHRLMTEALAEGSGTQHAMADALFAAYWSQGRDIGDHEVLTDVAAACGLSAARAREVLAGDEHAAAVREEERQAQQSGVHAVPTFVFDRRGAVSGAQPPEVLAGAVRRALAAVAG
jgi:predicted DsbA family dithiol-disulfide isomerase